VVRRSRQVCKNYHQIVCKLTRCWRKIPIHNSGGISNHDSVIYNCEVQVPSLNQATINVIKVKVKLSLCFVLTEHHAMKAYWGSGGHIWQNYICYIMTTLLPNKVKTCAPNVYIKNNSFALQITHVPFLGSLCIMHGTRTTC